MSPRSWDDWQHAKRRAKRSWERHYDDEFYYERKQRRREEAELARMLAESEEERVRNLSPLAWLEEELLKVIGAVA